MCLRQSEAEVEEGRGEEDRGGAFEAPLSEEKEEGLPPYSRGAEREYAHFL